MFTLALAAAALAVPQASSGDTIHVVSTYEVFTTQLTCEEMLHNPTLRHIPSGELEVRDSAGRLLGAGRLDLGLQTPTSCIFSTEFDANVAPDGLYQVSVGGGGADATTFTDESFINGMLTARIGVNDLNDDFVPDSEEATASLSEYQRAYQAWTGSGLTCEDFLAGPITDAVIAAKFSGDVAVMRQVLDDHCTPLAPLFEQD